METGALIGLRSAPRALSAAGLLAALLAALLGAWFLSGWHDVQLRQRELREAPRAAAGERADRLARELRAELEALVVREVRRPYFHYQNLMRDPNASAGLNVSPSPLARGSEDKLVLGHFQLDAKGHVITPTINDDVPELSESEHLAANHAFRERVMHDLSRHLAPPMSATGPLVADVASTPPRSPLTHSRPESALPSPQQAQVIQVDPNVYAQNTNSNAVYSQQSQFAKAPGSVQQSLTISPIEWPTRDRQQASPRAPSPVSAKPPPPVTITVSPLEWRTLPFGGVPALVATRQVQTPDGALAQGFVVNHATLTNWLATRADEMVAELHRDDSRGADIAAGWRLTVEPNTRTLARAAAEAGAVADTFLLRFIGAGSIAALAAAFVVLLVMRAEKLARERSQFAAAAAHELRTPLAGLQLYGDLLAEGLGDPNKVRDYARRMSDEASRLGRVVSNVLGFSQLERGHLTVDAQVGPLDEALCELAERARPTLDRVGATLHLDVVPDLSARFDRDALARIVGNLLDNAEKYARGAADRSIRLSARHRGHVVEVSIEDRGPGIDEKAKLFHPFARGQNGSDAPAGLGLGLALSMSLARAMGGELQHKPREGGGATFVLLLPSA